MTVTRACCAVTGVLRGFDTLVNLVLDETVEYFRGEWRYAEANGCDCP
jgi:small nuclear ribonucleoprotein (snRNP)-like protein